MRKCATVIFFDEMSRCVRLIMVQTSDLESNASESVGVLGNCSRLARILGKL